ncbi:MAG: hypothetical protein ACRD4C_04470 [Candidatus Acidiferrales bacterium]
MLKSRGWGLLRISKQAFIRVLVVALALAVFALSTQVVAHSDGLAHDEAHCTCQLCHISHAAVPQPAAHAQIENALQVTKFTPEEQTPAVAISAGILSNPRAPPA